MGDVDVIKAIRKNRQDGLSRKIISKVFNIWSRLRFGLKLTDINGYPVYFKKEVYKEVNDGSIRTDWIFNTDLLRRIMKKKYQVKDVVIIHRERSEGQSKMVPSRIVKMVIKYIKYK